MSRNEVENQITNFWESHRMFEKSVKERSAKKEYVFYDGPPFATGTPHQGHILGLTSKDLFPRYWTMKGFRVNRRWGWDCHGLPIENIAEKELGIKNKQQIEEMGVAKFNEFCRSKVLHYVSEWKKTVIRNGNWIEFDNSYKTMDQSYIESVWALLKNLHEKGFIYEGKKILMYCPRCQTPLSNSEIQMDNSYKDVTEKTATVGFKINGKEDDYLLVWTTTPWTLLGNAAVAVNSKLDYVKVDVFGKKFILAKELLAKTFDHYELLEEFKGKKLIGLEYEPLYDMPLNGKKGFYVLDGGEEVTAAEGTGLVHMAIYGEFDYLMIKKYDLPIIQHIGKDGKLALGPEKWIGTWFKNLDAEILADLGDRGLLISNASYTHSYPFCYRCSTPLIYNAVDSWFINIQKIKPKLIEKTKDIKWHPENMRERFSYILKTAPDWSISRNRFWASAIPVWKCKCGEIKFIGSIKELQKNAIEKVSDNVDLHKHVVDNIHLLCTKCKKTMTRIPEVLDCWAESGSMPYAAKHFPFENKKWMEDNFPADFVSEYVAQIRAWFYYMHVLGVLYTGKAPFKNIVVSGNMLAEDGNKMSKSKNNYTDPAILYDTYGADALRFYLMSSPLMKALDVNFSNEGVKEISRRLVTILSNVKNFYDLFAGENKVFDDDSSKNILDKWIISRTNSLIKKSTEYLDDYNTVNYCADILDFVDELSTWFVRRSRDRFKNEDKKERTSAFRTMAFVLDSLARVIAPVAPFIAEEVYQSVRGNKLMKANSVHLEAWPKAKKVKINIALEKEMVVVRNIVTKALEQRTNSKIAVKQPLVKLTVSGANVSEKLFGLIMDEINVKKVVLVKKTDKEITTILDTNITQELKVEGLARELMRKINDMRKKANLIVSDRISVVISTQSKLIESALKDFNKEILHSAGADKIVLGSAVGVEVLLGEEKVIIEIKVLKK